MPSNPQPVRLGFLLPERNVTCEVEFPRYLPDGITAHFSRLPREQAELKADSLVQMMESVDAQSVLLSKIDVRVIMAACTSGTFLGGTMAADDLGARIETATGIPGITTSTAVADALRVLGVHRFFMITPYPTDITASEATFFEALGFEVTGTDTFGCSHSPMIPAIPSAEVAEMAERHADEIKAADGVFISCTNLATMDRLSALEQRFGKPVVSSNSATLWRALRAAGVPTGDIGAGSLFSAALSPHPSTSSG